MTTLPFVEIQDITFTARQLGFEDVSITYLNGGIAEAEVVTVSGHSITVSIASGTSIADDIADAIEASPAAMRLVSVEVTGTGSNTQLTCVNASLSGGTPAVAASLVIGGIRYTADTAGTAGNDIRIKYTTGTILVSVSTNDITVRFPVGTTAAAIRTAIEGSGPAAALVNVSSSGAAGSQVQTLAMAPAFVNLAGGLAATKAATIVQDMTFEADSTGTADNGRKVSYSTGATAGAEVVTGTTNINVQIENAVSTATQIKAALDAYAPFNGVKASGTVTITDFAAAHLTAATGSLTVVDYTLLQEASATATITVVDFAELTGAVLTVNGTALTEGVEWTAAVDNNTTAASLELAVEAVTGISSLAAANAITATVVTPGSAGNAFTLVTSDAVNLTISGATFAGGRNYGTVVVNGVTLTAVAAGPSAVQFVPETSNDVTATNLEVAVEAVTGINSSAATNVISITAATPGAAGNAITLVVSGSNAGVTRSAATLAGGIDAATVTVGATTLVESTNFNSVTNNNTAADNLAAAIDAITGVSAPNPAAAIITVSADAVDASGNLIALSKTGSGITVSGSGFLSGGVNGLNAVISGTAGTAQVTVNSENPAEGVGPGPDVFFRDQTDAATGTYVFQSFGFGANRLSVYNDETSGSDTLVLSLDGITPFMVLSPTESIVNFEIEGRITGLYVKYETGAPNFRILASGLY